MRNDPGAMSHTAIAPVPEGSAAAFLGEGEEGQDPTAQSNSSRTVARRRIARTRELGPVRAALLDRDSGFRLVLARRMSERGWHHHEFASQVPAKRLLELDVEVVIVDAALFGTRIWRWLDRVAVDERGPALVVCTAESTPGDRVRALRIGADDWLGKPCHPEEVIARVESVLRQRRRFGWSAEPLLAGELELRPGDFQAFVGGSSLNLTMREFQVLDVLFARPDTTLAREAIYTEVWGTAMPRDDRSVDVVVHKLRRKLLSASPRWVYIHTHPAVGYSFAPSLLAGDVSGGRDLVAA
jgi:DNA-binding response OmpR family regulator